MTHMKCIIYPWLIWWSVLQAKKIVLSSRDIFSLRLAGDELLMLSILRRNFVDLSLLSARMSPRAFPADPSRGTVFQGEVEDSDIDYLESRHFLLLLLRLST